MEVIEYFLDGDYIKGWQLWPEKKKPELKGIPMPLEEMKEIGALKDEYGNYKYKLKNNKITKVNPEPIDSQLALKEFRQTPIIETIKKLIAGIEDKKSQEYLSLKELMDRI